MYRYIGAHWLWKYFLTWLLAFLLCMSKKARFIHSALLRIFKCSWTCFKNAQFPNCIQERACYIRKLSNSPCGLHFNNDGLLIKLHNRVVHIITKETIHHALEKIPLSRLYINMYNQHSMLIQTAPGFVVVKLPDHLFSSEEYFLLYHHNGGYLPLPYGRKYYVQLDRLIHAVEYLGFSRIKMNYDLLDLLSSDCLRIKRKNIYEGLYIAY